MRSIALRAREQWLNLTWAEALTLLGCSVLLVASKWAGKILEGTPGHSGAFWIPVLFLAVGSVRKPGGAGLTAFLGGAVWFGPRSGGGQLLSYVVAGLVLDAFGLNAERLRKLPFALLAGVVCHLAKFCIHNIPSALVGKAGGFALWGTEVTAGFHVLFGLIGGLVGWGILNCVASRRSDGHA
ncbi:MAG: hypothetical protein AUJ92_10330 [Armatimonadetes bacterium CG2_30_59_28]|nr:hypothetical protein [Armatimonadota bacterium]OIO94342.1 MAG: hypothetical protein AUJ92_10330 [Armatimonadetes bacterium CG2_30_59_28]PIU60932.1 MAG: hypothetical protein COS85_22165 [Armatimonadetes bacterium CG07_land_8_20_14_0_80_59_28]